MTAIFAYAKGDVAFVIGDTKRGIALGDPVCAKKVHYWSDTVVIAQAGDGKFQSELLADLIVKQPNIEGALIGQPSDEQFLEGFRRRRPTHYQDAAKFYSNLASGTKLITGTLLVASAADAAGPARIYILDFQTGQISRSANAMEASGDDAVAFAAIASTELAKLAKESPFAIDQWGLRCIDQAVQKKPKTVGWPADMMLSRQSSSKTSRIVLARRAQSADEAPLAEFAV